MKKVLFPLLVCWFLLQGLPCGYSQVTGRLDPAFRPPVTDFPADAVVIQPDGKAVIAGRFTTVNGVAVGPVIRLNADGTLDLSFNNANTSYLTPGDRGNSEVIALQPDGKILASINGYPSFTDVFVRLNADGSQDTAFSATTDGTVSAIAVQPDGKILIAGFFSEVNGVTVQGSIARLNADGSTDASFTPPPSPTDPSVSFAFAYGLALQPDGKVLVIGDLSQSNDTGLVRLNANGSLDRSFAVTDLPNAAFADLALQPDGKVVVTGNFSSFKGQPIAYVARINGTDGSLDTSFNPGQAFRGVPNTIVVRPDGKLIFTSAGRSNRSVIMLNSDGSADPTFSPNFDTANSDAYDAALQADGNLIVVGFLALSASSQPVGAVRLLANGSNPQSLTPTTFFVNGSDQPFAVAPGAALTFTATQGAPFTSGVYVRVQATTTPLVERSWTDLPDTTNGGAGFLHNDGNGNYSLTTTQYPRVAGVFFRAISAAPNQTDSISNFVGGFDLSGSTTTPTPTPTPTTTPTPTPVPPPASLPDLRIGQLASTEDSPNASVAIVGDQITYTFFVRNYGPATAYNLKVTNVLASHLHLEAADAGYTLTDGNIITWTFPQLSPNPNNPLTLRLVASVTSDAPVGSVITNRGYSVQADGTGIVQGIDVNPTTIIPPLEVIVRADGSSVTPGQTLTYNIAVTNRSPGTVKGINLSVPLPDSVQFVKAGFVDAESQPVSAPVSPDGSANPHVNGTNLLCYVGTLKAGKVAHIQVTVQIPFDVDPSAPIVLPGALVTTKTSVGGVNSFALPDTSTPLSGQGAAGPPLISFAKTPIDPVGVLQLFGAQPKLFKKLEKALTAIAIDPALTAQFEKIYPGLAALNPSTATLPDLVTALNPDVSYESAETAGQLATSTVLAPTAQKPTYIAFVLPYSNDGGATASNVVIQDRVPDGTTLYDRGTGAYNGSVIISGQPGNPGSGGNLEILDGGRTLRFHVGNLKPGKSGFVIYKVRVLGPGESGAPSIDSVITSSGSVLSTPSLSHTYPGMPDGQDLTVVGRYAYYLESTQYTSNTTALDQGVIYEIYYSNTGSRASKILEIDDPVPPGLQYVGCELLDANHNSLPGAGLPSGATDTPIDRVNGTVVFHPPMFTDKGKVKAGDSGYIRVFFQPLPTALASGHGAFVHSPFIADSSFVTNAAGSGHGPAARAASASGPGARLQKVKPAIRRDSSNVTRVDDPSISRLFLASAVPMAMVEDQDSEIFVAEGSTNNTLLKTGYINLVLPPGIQFVSMVGEPSALTSQSTDSSGSTTVSIKVPSGVFPHQAVPFKITVHPRRGMASQTPLVFPNFYLGNPADTQSVQLQTGPVNVRVLTAGEFNAISSMQSQVAGSALSAFGVSSPLLSEFVSHISGASRTIIVAGASAVSSTNGAVVVPLLGTPETVLAIGPTSAVGTNVLLGGPSFLKTNNNDFVVMTGQASQVDLSGAAALDGSSLPPQDAGAMLNAIRANQPGNALTAGAATLLHGGGANILANDGATLIGQDGTTLGLRISEVVSNDGGTFAAGRSNTSGIIGEHSSGILGENGSGLTAKGLVISNDGGTLLATQGGSATAASGASIVSDMGNGIIGENGSGLRGTPDNTAALHATAAGMLVQVGSTTGVVNTNGSNLLSPGGSN